MSVVVGKTIIEDLAVTQEIIIHYRRTELQVDLVVSINDPEGKTLRKQVLHVPENIARTFMANFISDPKLLFNGADAYVMPRVGGTGTVPNNDVNIGET